MTQSSTPGRPRTGRLAWDLPTLLQRATTATIAKTELALEPFPDVRLVLRDLRLRQTPRGPTIVGAVAAPFAGERGYLVFDKESVLGVVRAGPWHYRLESGAGSSILVTEIDAGAYGRELPPRPPASPTPLRALARANVNPNALTAAGPSEIDVLVAYTPAVAARHVRPDMAARVRETVEMANEAFAASGINVVLRAVPEAQVNYTESGSFDTDLDRLQGTNDGGLDEVHTLRDKSGADVVILLVADGDACGKANLAVVSSDADDDSAFAVVNDGCIEGHTFTHELGHIFGAHHDYYVDGSPLPHYAHGFVSLEGEWRTIMAYDKLCQSHGKTCRRLDVFSNPRLRDDRGRPLGDFGSADNSRRLNETAVTVEGFRLRGPRVSLYEGNNATQDHVCVVGAAAVSSVNFTDSSNMRFCDNDEARSLALFEVPAGQVLRLYDRPDGRREDDWLEIRVKRAIGAKAIGTFERSFEDDDLQVIYHRNDGLDGKVSRLEFSLARSGPTLDLFEGNGASQNLVCSLPIGQPVGVPFPGHSECDNDEARSFVLYDVPAGTVLRFFDSATGAREDDWTELVVKRSIGARMISSFEAFLDDADLRMTYHRNDGLDGKVSRLEVSAGAAGPTLDLHEGNNGAQNLVCSLPIGQLVSLDFTRHNECDNDEARSFTLWDVPAGRFLLFFDNQSGNREDDWTAVQTLRPVRRKIIGTFERTFEDADVRVFYFRNNGIDGKISRLEVTTSSGLPGVLSLYEGNNASQNKVCELSTGSQVVRFKSHDACDNDEARSMLLTLVPRGTIIEVYDDPDCRTRDDWTAIVVNRDIFRATIKSFERSFSDQDVTVEHHHHNGLDGKVSCLRVRAP